MGKSCSAKSCIALAAAASLKKAQAGGLKEEMVWAHIRLKSSALQSDEAAQDLCGCSGVRAAGSSPRARPR